MERPSPGVPAGRLKNGDGGRGPVTSKQGKRDEAGLNGERTLTQMAYRKIKDMMFSYEIIPGQRLVFVDLAKKIGVSRTPVNQALSILASEGFLDFIPHQGYAVHELTHEEAGALYQVREIIEMGAIELAIRKITPEKLKTLHRKKDLIAEKLTADQVSRRNFVLDQEFHLCYIDMAGNPYLTNYFQEVYQRIFLRHRLEGLSISRNQEVVAEHEEIFKAISRKDVKRAKELLKRHIRSAEKSIFSVFG
jgi:DNA-binding GntR family transcriptional regulator